jgi:hypothetical protein
MRTYHLSVILLLGGFLLAPITIVRAAETIHNAPAVRQPVLGLYQLSLVGHEHEQQAELLLKGCESGFCGYLLTGDHSASLENLILAGDTLRATVMTNAGRGTLELRLDPTGLTGTLTVGRTAIAVFGARVTAN